MSAQTSGEATKWGSEKARLEAFSDGVFAIAITLLVLNLKVPTSAETSTYANGLAGYLFSSWPVYAAYIFSFLTILLMWIAHHNFFNYVARVDTGLLLTNGFQLMGITIVPFTTALLAQWVTDPIEGGLAAAIYSVNFAFITFMVFLQFIIAAHTGKVLRPDLRPGLVEAIRMRNLIGPTFYFLATLLGIFVGALACLFVCALLLVYYTMVILFLARRWFEG
jgi:uncharacterized membrane protein